MDDSAPGLLLASDRDHRRWNERFSGKPVGEAQGAFRFRVADPPRGLRRWHVEAVIGAQRFSVSSHDDRETAAELASNLVSVSIGGGSDFSLLRIPASLVKGEP